MKNATLHEAEIFFHERIPLTRAMGVRVVVDEENGFAVEAPVALNHNHMQTAFGGSINALATLAGYAFLWFELRGESAQMVIADSSIRFHRPVRRTIRAICAEPDSQELARFKATLREKGKSRIALSVRVEEDLVRAAQFEATFVALRNPRT